MERNHREQTTAANHRSHPSTHLVLDEAKSWKVGSPALPGPCNVTLAVGALTRLVNRLPSPIDPAGRWLLSQIMVLLIVNTEQ